jgi:hypothetical protein
MITIYGWRIRLGAVGILAFGAQSIGDTSMIGRSPAISGTYLARPQKKQHRRKHNRAGTP